MIKGNTYNGKRITYNAKTMTEITSLYVIRYTLYAEKETVS